MARKLTVVLSQAPGKHPAKRSLEESLAAALLMEPGVDLSIVPNLYDIGPEHTARMFLESVSGDMIVLSWLYPRAAFWLLDRDGIRGHMGESQLKAPDDDEEESKEEEPAREPGIGSTGTLPDRHIYTLDLRMFNKTGPYLDEVRRIVAECTERRAKQAAEKAASNPVMISLGLPSKNGDAKAVANTPEENGKLAEFTPEALLAPANRRWYPVIDYSRCTNCLECLDFCLFGVYGVDSLDRIVTENQDQCKKGCPACSRVCPQQAIIFPEYKSAAIAGADGGAAVGGLKIDLSKLFGGGESADPLSAAVAERDRELVADGRNAVGMSVGIPKRQVGKPTGPKDDLDKLVDDLDSLGL